MKLNQRLRVFTTTLIVTSLLLPLSVSAAATRSSAGTVRAQIHGQPIAAIAVGDTTYVNWGALERFGTPHEYLGNGMFAITGGTVQGVIYKGNTYLPWASVAPRVKAMPLKGGGFNFTSIPVTHNYHVVIATQNGTVGRPNAMEIATIDGGNVVPHQTVQLRVNGNSFVSGYSGKQSFTITTDENGLWIGALNDVTPQSVSLTATWIDPSGKVHTGATPIAFSSAAPTATSIPSGDTAVATVPMTTFQNAILFNAQAAGQTILFQLDTGAYEPMITKHVADLLHLPNLGQMTIQGVAGQGTAYQSEISLTIGGKQFNNVPCLVDDNYSGPSLFGYGFFANGGYDLLVSQKDHTISILK